jgi:PAS domain-containing protein
MTETPLAADAAVDTYGFLSSVLAGIAQPVWVVDPAGDIRFTNPAAIAALGYDDAVNPLDALSEHPEKLSRRVDRQLVAQPEQMLITGHEKGLSIDGEREQVVIVRIGRTDRRRTHRIFGKSSVAAQPADVSSGLLGGNALAELGVAERALEFCQEEL